MGTSTTKAHRSLGAPPPSGKATTLSERPRSARSPRGVSEKTAVSRTALPNTSSLRSHGARSSTCSTRSDSTSTIAAVVFSTSARRFPARSKDAPWVSRADHPSSSKGRGAPAHEANAPELRPRQRHAIVVACHGVHDGERPLLDRTEDERAGPRQECDVPRGVLEAIPRVQERLARRRPDRLEAEGVVGAVVRRGRRRGARGRSRLGRRFRLARRRRAGLLDVALTKLLGDELLGFVRRQLGPRFRRRCPGRLMSAMGRSRDVEVLEHAPSVASRHDDRRGRTLARSGYERTQPGKGGRRRREGAR